MMKHFGDCQAYTIIIFFQNKNLNRLLWGEKNIRRICKFYFRMTVFQARFWLNTKINKIVYRGRRWYIA